MVTYIPKENEKSYIEKPGVLVKPNSPLLGCHKL